MQIEDVLADKDTLCQAIRATEMSGRHLIGVVRETEGLLAKVTSDSSRYHCLRELLLAVKETIGAAEP